jgi:hypothetical protein
MDDACENMVSKLAVVTERQEILKQLFASLLSFDFPESYAPRGDR